jgi:hypothetical protein
MLQSRLLNLKTLVKKVKELILNVHGSPLPYEIEIGIYGSMYQKRCVMKLFLSMALSFALIFSAEATDIEQESLEKGWKCININKFYDFINAEIGSLDPTLFKKFYSPTNTETSYISTDINTLAFYFFKCTKGVNRQNLVFWLYNLDNLLASEKDPTNTLGQIITITPYTGSAFNRLSVLKKFITIPDEGERRAKFISFFQNSLKRLSKKSNFRELLEVIMEISPDRYDFLLKTAQERKK